MIQLLYPTNFATPDKDIDTTYHFGETNKDHPSGWSGTGQFRWMDIKFAYSSVSASELCV